MQYDTSHSFPYHVTLTSLSVSQNISSHASLQQKNHNHLNETFVTRDTNHG